VVRRARDDALRSLHDVPGPVVCLLDEIDSKPSEAWPYEALLPFLEPSAPRDHSTCYCLAGSGGADLEELERRLRARPKGTDLLSRIPRANQYTVSALGPGDKLLVAVIQLVLACRLEGIDIDEVEKLAMFYIATSPSLSSARELRNLAAECARRIPAGERRIKFDYLFPAGDPENKLFWNAAAPFRAELANTFLSVSAGNLPARAPGARTAPPRRPAPTRGTPDRASPRLAVLPLANISPDPQDAYLADGLTEEMISVFSKIRGLRVIARASVAGYQQHPKSISEIGAELGISAALEGSVRKAGGRVRVSLQLVDVATEEHLWAETYDRQLDDVFAIQADVAQRAARVLQVELFGAGGPSRPAEHRPNLKAYELYLRGIAAYRGFTDDSFERAVDLFDRSIQADPEFVGAYSQLAHLLIGVMGQTRPRSEILPRATELVAHALRLAPDSSDAHSARANLALQVETDWATAEREFRVALDLNPSDVLARFWYGYLLGTLQRYPEGIAQLTAALEDDPLNVGVRYVLMMLHWFSGDLPTAVQMGEAIVDSDPSQSSFHAWLGMIYLAAGRVEDAKAEAARSSSEGGLARIWRAQLFADLGDEAYAEGLLTRLEEQARHGYVPPMDLAGLNAILGRTDRALELLEEDGRRGDRALWITYQNPTFDRLRREPRFVACLQEMHLPTTLLRYPPPDPRAG
jgi:TolB-like protein